MIHGGFVLLFGLLTAIHHILSNSELTNITSFSFSFQQFEVFIKFQQGAWPEPGGGHQRGLQGVWQCQWLIIIIIIVIIIISSPLTSSSSWCVNDCHVEPMGMIVLLLMSLIIIIITVIVCLTSLHYCASLCHLKNANLYWLQLSEFSPFQNDIVTITATIMSVIWLLVNL